MCICGVMHSSLILTVKAVHPVVIQVIMIDRSAVKKKSTKRYEKEEEVDETFKGLKQQHGEKYSGPQL